MEIPQQYDKLDHKEVFYPIIKKLQEEQKLSEVTK